MSLKISCLVFVTVLVFFVNCFSTVQIQGNANNYLRASNVQKPEPPTNFRVTLKTSRNVRVTWDAPKEIPGKTTRYKVFIKKLNQITTTDKTTQFLLGFQPWTGYNISLTAFLDEKDQASYSNSVTLRMTTNMEAPSPPDGLTLRSPSSTIITAHWDKPMKPNGNLEGYNIRWSSTGATEGLNVTQYTITGLKAWTEYRITVFAFNKEGDQVFKSTTVEQARRTEPDEPDPPQNVAVKDVSFDSARITWSPPATSNGPLNGYDLTWARQGESQGMVTVLATTNEYLLQSLTPWSEYEVTVSAYNSGNMKYLGKPGKVTFSTAVSGVGPVRDLVVKPGQRNLTLEWETPVPTDIVIAGYMIKVDENEQTVTRTSYTWVNLSPWTEYNVSVTAYGMKPGSTEIKYGPSSSKLTKTLSAEPGPPVNLMTIRETKSSVHISWEKPKVPNGPIAGYVVTFSLSGHVLSQSDATDMEFIKGSLTPWTDYVITVAAFNNRDQRLTGESANITARTGPSEPEPPVNQKVIKVSRSSVQFGWEKPKVPNGPVSGYTVTCSLNGHLILENDTTALNYEFEGLAPWTDYVITVAAFNNLDQKLTGKATNINVRTGASVPLVTGKIEANGKSQTTIELKTSDKLFSDKNGPVTEYVLLVARSDGMNGIPQSGLELANQTQFFKWQEAKGSNTMYRSSPKGWMIGKDNDICKTEQGHLLCTVGKQNNCDKIDFCNGPLQRKITYRIKIRGYSEGGFSESNVLQIQTSASILVSSTSGLVLALLVVALGQRSY